MNSRKLAIGLMLLFVGTMVLPSCSSQKGFDYKAHSKKGKKTRYKGDLTQYNCRKR